MFKNVQVNTKNGANSWVGVIYTKGVVIWGIKCQEVIK